MSESGDYDPGPWKAHDFKDAKKSYDKHVGRSYDDAKKEGKTASSLIEASLHTDSKSPVVIACDVTGSMGEWPAVIFSKLPYLELEGKEYLGKTMEISFAAVGDVYSDKYPLQTRPFTSGTDLKTRLEELVIEGNGGGQTCESYDLCALYYARKVEMQKATRNPIFIFIGDEGLYDFVDKDHAERYTNISLEKRLSSKQVMEELKKKYSVYVVRKPYDNSGDQMSSTDRRIQSQWEEYLGADHVTILPSAERVVDAIFGIFAKETERFNYFKQELIDRQSKDQDGPEKIATVLKAMKSIHKLSDEGEPK